MIYMLKRLIRQRLWLLVAGAVVAPCCVAKNPIEWVDNEVREHIGTHPMHHVDDIMQFVPDVLMIVPDAWHSSNKYEWRDRMTLVVTGELLTEVVIQPTKRLIDRRRPDGSDWSSFPSGHSARAFMGAELLRITYGRNTGWIGYGIATLTGIMRVCGERHWVSDVVVGAGIGVGCAQLAKLILPFEKRLFDWTPENVSVSSLPVVDFQTHSATVAISVIF